MGNVVSRWLEDKRRRQEGNARIVTLRAVCADWHLQAETARICLNFERVEMLERKIAEANSTMLALAQKGCDA